MKKFFLALLLASFPANMYASLERLKPMPIRELAKLEDKPESDEVTIIITDETKFFLDGKPIKEIPPSTEAIVQRVVLKDKITMEALEIYFKSKKVKD